MVVICIDSGPCLIHFESLLYHLLPELSWETFFISLNLSFLIYIDKRLKKYYLLKELVGEINDDIIMYMKLLV